MSRRGKGMWCAERSTTSVDWINESVDDSMELLFLGRKNVDYFLSRNFYHAFVAFRTKANDMAPTSTRSLPSQVRLETRGSND